MKTTTLLVLAALTALLASCTTNAGSSGATHDNMPGMSSEEHAKMKH